MNVGRADQQPVGPHQSEQWLRALIEQSAAGIAQIDLRGHLLFANQRYCEIIGYSKEEVLGLRVHDLTHPDDRPHTTHMVSEAAVTGQEYGLEKRYIRKDGSTVWVNISASVLKDEADHLHSIMGVVVDVSDRKGAEEELRRGESRLKLAVDALGLGLWDVDLTDHTVIESENFVAMLGLPPHARHTSLTEWEKYLHPDDYERARDKFLGALEGRCEYEDEQRLVGADGVLRWVHVTGNVVRDASGQPIRMVGVCTDITDRKQWEERLQESEERLRLGLDAGDTGTWDWDIASDRVTWSERVYQFHGLTKETFGGHVADFQRIIHPEDRQRVGEAIQAAIEKGPNYEVDFRVVRNGGEIGWLTTTGRVYRDASGTPVRMLGATRDVTQQKQAEQERDALLASERALRSEAERANQLKDEFLATVSHELRTPLNAILGYAQVLRYSGADGQELSEGLEVIERNARVQAQIIGDLLDMSRIISGTPRLDVQQVNLPAVIDAALETVRPAANAKGIELVWSVSPLVAPISGDPARLQQVVWNLLSNAIKFTPSRGRVQVSLEPVEAHLELIVSDTGTGISPEFLPHVFDKFRQADAAITRRHGGLGLGLAIVKNLVELHGGTIQAHSQGENTGSTFQVTLPLTPVRTEAAPHPAHPTHPTHRVPAAADPTPSPQPDVPRLAGLHVLVVEDDPDARNLTRKLLEDGNARVTTAASVDEAMERLGSSRFDVIVSDIGMPQRDGYDLIRAVRSLPADAGGTTPATPAIAMTALARSQDRTQALLAGFNMHLSKPADPRELRTVIASLANRIG